VSSAGERGVLKSMLSRGSELASEAGSALRQDVPATPRGGPKTLLPSSWTGRSVKIEYRSADGYAGTISGKLLDLYPAGPVIGTNGTRCVLAWDAIVLTELQDV
jgi:hypothetical protein